MNRQKDSETNEIKIVAVIQCAIALERCSGFHCSWAFHKRENYFKDYGHNILYVPFSCGGCPGRRVSRLIANLEKGTKRKMGMDRKSIAVHFTACVVTDNGHYPTCPFKDYMKAIVSQKGFKVIEGGYESKGSAKRRASGYYNAYQCCNGENQNDTFQLPGYQKFRQPEPEATRAASVSLKRWWRGWRASG